MELLAVIPARGGSKGLPRKNLAPLAGRPMLAYTADCVLGCSFPIRPLLSTDDGEIAAVGARLGLEVPFHRPPELATDGATTQDVVRHAVEFLRQEEGYEPDLVLILQPTSPLRTAEHLERALVTLADGDYDSLISFAPLRRHPEWAYRIEDGLAVPLQPDRPSRRQELARLWYPTGGIYIVQTGFLSTEQMFGSRIAPFMMTHWEAVDVDDAWDLAVAEAALIHRSRLSS